LRKKKAHRRVKGKRLNRLLYQKNQFIVIKNLLEISLLTNYGGRTFYQNLLMRQSHNLLFHQTLKTFKEQNIQHKKMIVGVSGGLDSMVLMSLLQELSSVCKLELFIAHVHHGQAGDKKIKSYRDKAKKLVLQACAKNQLALASFESKKKLNSEEEFRNFRLREFKKLLVKKKADLIVLAHNQNDLLETRLINLIRGSGPQGLQSMSFYQAPFLRPLLIFSRKEIKKYTKARKIAFVEDPSNKDNSYLRNWIRNKWLKDLEKKRSGSVKSLSKSLDILANSEQTLSCLKPFSSSKQPLPHSINSIENLSSHIKTVPLSELLSSKGIDRKAFLELSLVNQKRVLASYMRRLNLSHYGQSHIQELLKHNQRLEKNFQVKLLKKTWLFTKDKIQTK